MNMPLLSILIPTYNSSETILRVLQAIPKTSDIEIIINDDGSMDETKEKCERWFSENPGVKFTLLSSNHEGVSLSRRKLIDNSNGKYVLFVDSDDLVNGDELLLVLEELKHNDYDLINSPYLLISEYKQQTIEHVPQNLDDYITELVFSSKTNALWTKIIKREILKNALFYKEVTNGEDKIALLSIFNLIKKYYATKHIFAIHILNNMSITRTKPNKFLFKRLINYYNALFPILKDINMADDERNIYLFWETLALYCHKIDKNFIISANIRKDLKTIKTSEWYQHYKSIGKKVRKKLPFKYKILLFLHHL